MAVKNQQASFFPHQHLVLHHRDQFPKNNNETLS